MDSRMRLRAGLALGLLLASLGAVRAGEPAKPATISGKALAVTGEPVAGVRVTAAEHTFGGKEGKRWTATTSPQGTLTIAVPVPGPGMRTLYLEVEGPPGGRLAPTSVTPQSSLRLAQGQRAQVTILLAPATAKLAGTVTGGDGKPLADATVTLQMSRLHRALQRTATSDRRGRYEIAALAPGSYVVSAVNPPPGTSLIGLYTWRPTGVRAVSLKDGQTATEDFQLPLGARLLGRVVGEKGKPIAAAAVSCGLDWATEVGPRSVYQRPGQNYRASSKTDARGCFSLGGLTQETYRVVAEPPEGTELAPAILRGVSTPPTGDVKLQDVTLYRGGVLVGKVVGEDGKAIAGASVSMPLNLRRRFGQPLSATADETGTFRFRGLPSGRYTVTIRPPEGSEMTDKTFADAVVLSGLSLERRFALPQGARVVGTVTAPDGRPVPGASVWARYGYHNRGKATTDAEGKFAILGVSPPARSGPRRHRGPQNQVLVSPPAAFPLLRQTSVPLPDVPARGSATVDVRMQPAAALTGRITGPDGKPLAGCRLRAMERKGRGTLIGHASAVTDDEGRYTIPHLPSARLHISVQPPGGTRLLAKETPARAHALGKTATVNVALDTGATLVGKLVSSAGKPVVGAQVLLKRAALRHRPVAKTATSSVGGAFRMEPVAPGDYELESSSPDRGLFTTPVPLKVAGTGEQKVRVVLYRAGTIKGTVLDAKGKPFARGVLWVRVDPVAGGAGQRTKTPAVDAKGHFALGGFAPGKYTVRVNFARRGQQMGLVAPPATQVALQEGKEATVNLVVKPKAGTKGTDF